MKIVINIFLCLYLCNSVAQLHIDSLSKTNPLNKNLIYDSVRQSYRLKVVEIQNISNELEIIIDRYIFNRRKINSVNCYKNGFIYLWISPSLNEQYTKKNVYDSLFSINDFRKNDLLKNEEATYNARLNLLNINSKSFFGISGFNKLYYYNYKGFRVLIVSLLPLKFDENKKMDIEVLNNLSYKQKGKCDNADYSDYVYFYFSKIHVSEFRFKDLIHPKWTGGANMFE